MIHVQSFSGVTPRVRANGIGPYLIHPGHRNEILALEGLVVSTEPRGYRDFATVWQGANVFALCVLPVIPQFGRFPSLLQLAVMRVAEFLRNIRPTASIKGTGVIENNPEILRDLDTARACSPAVIVAEPMSDGPLGAIGDPADNVRAKRLGSYSAGFRVHPTPFQLIMRPAKRGLVPGLRKDRTMRNGADGHWFDVSQPRCRSPSLLAVMSRAHTSGSGGILAIQKITGVHVFSLPCPYETFAGHLAILRGFKRLRGDTTHQTAPTPRETRDLSPANDTPSHNTRHPVPPSRRVRAHASLPIRYILRPRRGRQDGPYERQ